MNKACASILIFVALFALVGAEDFMRIPLEQGTLRMRNLASTSAQSYNFDNFTNNFAVRVNLSSTYLTAIGLDNNTQTDMTLFLYTNVTGFCQNCNEFVPFGCGGNNCSYDTTQSQTMYNGPNYYVTSGNAFNFSNLTIGADNTTAAWKLNTTAFYFSNGPAYVKSVYYPYTTGGSTSSLSYVRNSSTYGFIGLGVGGNASQNFQTTTPIFSIQVNGTGAGSLIFGKDTTLIDSTKTPITLTTDTNWTMTSRNMSWGSTINNTNFYSYVIFDLQAPAVLLPSEFRSALWSSFATKYSLVYNTTFGNTDFPMTYNGSLTGLPDLNIGLTNDKNITIPPAAYTRRLANNFYAILIGFSDQIYNQSGSSYVNYTVLGYPVFSQYYTVFELPTTGIPTVTMYPNAVATSPSGSTGSSFSLKTLAIVAAVVLVVLVALSAVCKKKQDFTKSDLGVELRAARV